MARSRNSFPSYLEHKQSGRGRAVWTDAVGIRHYRLLPGPFDSQESKTAFARLQLEIATTPVTAAVADPGGISINEVLIAFHEHAGRHYRHPDGRPTSEVYEVNHVIQAIRLLYGEKPVTDFGPLAVKALRMQWVNEMVCRTGCSRRVGIVKRILKWAVSEQLAPVTVYQAVATVAGLQRGRSEAREMEPVAPVDDALVDATLPFLNRHVRGMVEGRCSAWSTPARPLATRR